MGNPDTGTEIELKFQVPADRLPALRRALATKTAREEELRAVYHDTADGRLAAAQLALRVRREGGRWLQTLKGPGDGLMQRLEHEQPCAGDLPAEPAPAVDIHLHAGTAAGQALQAALGRKATLQPMYGTEIRRLKRVIRHAGARVELALDVGEVTVGAARAPVCELEFELLSGPVTALIDLAGRWAARFLLTLDPATKSQRAQWLAQGLHTPPVVRAVAAPVPGPGRSLAEARSAMIAAALSQALPNAAALICGQGVPDHLHQLRVGLRRLRSVLRALGPDDPGRDAALTALFAALGAARDADVLAQTLAPAWAAAAAAGWPPPPTPAVNVSVATALGRPETTRLWLGLITLTQPVGDTGPPWEPAVIDALRCWRRDARQLAARWDDLDVERRHRLRKRLKRLRYLLEFAQPLLPPRRLRVELDRLRPLQDALGRWNDLAVAREVLARWQQPTPAVHFAAGWLAREAAEVEAACGAAAEAWRSAGDGLRGRDLISEAQTARRTPR